MNKKLLAVAVAGALALPGVALAQSSVTISGFIKMGVDNVKLGNSNKTSSSETRVQDDSSRIIFNVREDLGGGLAAIAQIDWRVAPDSAESAIHGNNHVGLQSKQWGRIFIGRQDVHYFNRESSLTSEGSLKADSISILAFANAGATPVANATRVPNIIHYTTPNWGGFTAIVAYSTNPGGVESDLGSGQRKGRAWHVNPNMRGANWQVGYSYYSAKSDAVTTAASVGIVGGVPAVVAGATSAADSRGDRLYGSYAWGGLKVGLAWDKSKIKNGLTGVETSNRTAWSLPASYRWGPHEIHAHYSKARGDKAAAFAGRQTSAKMFAMAYSYSMSKRTALALTYAKITNEANARYNFFTTTSGAIGSPSTGAAAGEDPRLLAVTLKHAF